MKKQKRERKNRKLIMLLDGFDGILALMIYNILLYLSRVVGIKGFIGRIENTTGYFGFNLFKDIGFSRNYMIIGIIFLFVIAFLIGIGIANLVWKVRKVSF